MIFNKFDVVYIINLDYREDRRREMEVQLQSVGLSYESPNVVLFKAIRPADAGSFPSIGARGCFLSHLGILEDAQKRKYKSILILEDDCNFFGECFNVLSGNKSFHLNNDWGIFYGGTLTKNLLLEDWGNFKLVPSGQALMGTHFVAINGSILAELINYFGALLQRPAGHPDGGPMHVDGAYSCFRAAHPNCITLLADPPLAYQRSSRTDIHDNKWYDKFLFIKEIIGMLRKFKNALRG